MNAPIKPKRTQRNQVQKFDETLAGSLPSSAPMNMPAVRPRLSSRQVRGLLGVIWVAAALLAGVGIGRLIQGSRQVAVTEAPTPVATDTVVVADTTAVAAGAASLGAVQPTIMPVLAATTAGNIYQAQAGSLVVTAAGPSLQGAQPSDALLPGFNHFGHPQGNIGTAPVSR